MSTQSQCGSSAQAAHLPCPRMATWESFLSLAMAPALCQDGLCHTPLTHPEGWHPRSPGSLGITSQADQLPADLGNAVPRLDAPCGSLGLLAQAFYKTAWPQAQPAQETSHAGSIAQVQGCTWDLLLSQTKMRAKGTETCR